MIGKKNEIARMQSDFYRDAYKKILSWLLAEVVIMLMLIAVIIYYVFFPAPPQYYATSSAGQLIALAPVK
jgi:hypothetical protein